MQWLIDKNGYQSRGMNGWSPALAASYGGHIDVLRLLIGLAACNAWARTKHFGCPSVIPSVCYPGMPL